MSKFEIAHDPKKLEDFFENIPVIEAIYNDWQRLKASTDNLVIPLEQIPQHQSSILTGEDGKAVLLHNDAMFMGYRLSCCEFSDFFLSIANQCKIIGNRCPKCNDLIVPPVVQRCVRESCEFAELAKEEVTDIGLLMYTTPIVLYPPSNFKSESPYALGWIGLTDQSGKIAATYLHMRVRTSRQFLTGGIFNKHIPVKVVFAKNRLGKIRDIFAVPAQELTKKQIGKSPLFESEIEWQTENLIEEYQFKKEYIEIFQEVYRLFEKLGSMIETSKKARKILPRGKR